MVTSSLTSPRDLCACNPRQQFLTLPDRVGSGPRPAADAGRRWRRAAAARRGSSKEVGLRAAIGSVDRMLSDHDATMNSRHRTKPLASARRSGSRTHDRERAEDHARRRRPRAAAPASGARRRCGWRRGGPRRWCRSTTTPRTRRWRRRACRCGCAGSAAPGCRRSSAGPAARPPSGFFSHRESERPAPGGRLVLDGPDADGALAAVARGRRRRAAVAGLRDPGAAA